MRSVKPDELKEVILQQQNRTEKGYYTFEEWARLHESLLSVGRQSLPMVNAWRVLKLINFGDDYVPTGLVFDILVTLLDGTRPADQTEALLKSIFFKFIEFNGKFLSEREREELAFFKVIRSVVEGYRKLMAGSEDSDADQTDRNHQLFRLHEVHTYRKNLEALKRIEEEFKQCKFEPELNPRSELAASRYLDPRPTPPRPDLDRYNTMVIDEQDEFPQGFRAQPVPAYPEVVPTGINEHLARMQKSREIKRINSLKPYRSGSSEGGAFGIEEREEARKERLASGYRLLFIIKAEVGKRIYRIKVRENMSVEEVVKNIEKMVGFPDSSLHDIVKNYFHNWQVRQQKLQMQSSA